MQVHSKVADVPEVDFQVRTPSVLCDEDAEDLIVTTPLMSERAPLDDVRREQVGVADPSVRMAMGHQSTLDSVALCRSACDEVKATFSALAGSSKRRVEGVVAEVVAEVLSQAELACWDAIRRATCAPAVLRGGDAAAGVEVDVGERLATPALPLHPAQPLHEPDLSRG
mmetsp:Transcript_46370/g.122494  ORF Transcript_46370/g.122494 Transcript_46370/m.122494 type:complete len:169 (-) Transcript_46370:11-517(-)